MKSIKRSSLIGPTILIVLICVGVWLYTKWDLKQSIESLPKPPSPQTTTRDASATEQATHLQVATENDPTMPSQPGKAVKNTETLNAEQPSDTVAVQEVPADTADPNEGLDMFLGDFTAGAVSFGDWTDNAEEAPYDMEVVKAGFDDYNTYLQSDPEYAYQRLDDAFREQYGDDPDVDILVEMIRHGNEGSMPIDKAIEGAEAMIRLVSKISPPEAIEDIQLFRDMLLESKQMGLEEGVEVEYKGKYHIGE